MGSFEGELTRVYENQGKADPNKKYWTLEFDKDKNKRASVWSATLMKKIFADFPNITVKEMNATLPIMMKAEAETKGNYVNITDIILDKPVEKKAVKEGDPFAKKTEDSKGDPFAQRKATESPRDRIEDKKLTISARQTSVNATSTIIAAMIERQILKTKDDITSTSKGLIDEFTNKILGD